MILIFSSSKPTKDQLILTIGETLEEANSQVIDTNQKSESSPSQSESHDVSTLESVIGEFNEQQHTHRKL